MDSVQMIGLTAGVLTTASFLPQVIKTWKSKSANDLSLLMFSMFCTGILMWLIYGLLINDLPIILSNIATLSLAGTILFFKFRFK